MDLFIVGEAKSSGMYTALTKWPLILNKKKKRPSDASNDTNTVMVVFYVEFVSPRGSTVALQLWVNFTLRRDFFCYKNDPRVDIKSVSENSLSHSDPCDLSSRDTRQPTMCLMDGCYLREMKRN